MPFSVGGLSSGIDSAGIVSQLMALERRPVQMLEQRQAQMRKADEAWGSVTTKLSAVRAAVDKVRRPDAFDAFTTATSTDPAAVAATTIGTPAPGGVTFTVSRLASIHQVVAGTGFADPNAVIGEGRVLTVTKQGSDPQQITCGATTTYADLARQIGELGLGLTASVVKTSDTGHTLVVASTSTGASQAFTVTGDVPGADAPQTLRSAADAVIVLGDSDGSSGATLELTRSSNTVTDLVEGVRLDLQRAGATVTVTTARDTAGAAAAVKGVVDALNGALTTLKDLTKYDPVSKRGGALQGDATARKLINDLLSAVSPPGLGLAGPYANPAAVGVRLDRYGAVTLDETKLNAALADDFAAVTGLFSRTVAVEGSSATRYLASTDATLNGAYTVRVTTPPADGVDIAGEFVDAGGTVWPATGKGSTLTGASGATQGLAVLVGATAAGDHGTVRLSGGFADMVSRVVTRTEGRDGAVTRARESLTSRIKVAQSSIDAYEIRLATRRTTLERKFAALESALARVGSQGTFLAGMMPRQSE